MATSSNDQAQTTSKPADKDDQPHVVDWRPASPEEAEAMLTEVQELVRRRGGSSRVVILDDEAGHALAEAKPGQPNSLTATELMDRLFEATRSTWPTPTTPPLDDRPDRLDRLAIGAAQTRAASAASAVSMPLGIWAGRGDWATYPDDFRDKAGARALTELDQAITELTAVRDRLAQAVGRHDGDAGGAGA